MKQILPHLVSIVQVANNLQGSQAIRDMLNSVGYELPEELSVTSSISDISSSVENVQQLLLDIYDEETPLEERILKIQEARQEITTIVDGVVELQTNLESDLNLIPNFLGQSSFRDEFLRRLFDYMILKFLEEKFFKAYSLLLLLGVASETKMEADESIFQPDFTLYRIHWDRLPTYFSDPMDVANQAYNWESDFNSNLFFVNLDRVTRAFCLPGNLLPIENEDEGVVIDETTERSIAFPIVQQFLSPETYWQLGLFLEAAPAEGGLKKGLALVPYAHGTIGSSLRLTDSLRLDISVDADLDSGLGLYLRPPTDFSLETDLFSSPQKNVDAELSIALVREASSDKFYLFGSEEVTHLGIGEMGLKVIVGMKDGKANVGLELDISEWMLAIKTAEGDGFISKIFSELELETNGSITLGHSLEDGFYIEGGAGLEIQLLINKTIGPFALESVGIGLALTDEKIALSGTVLGSIQLGPIEVVVGGLGMEVALEPGVPGVLGNADLSTSFQLPNQIGITVDAGIVKGGGFLDIDREKGEYAGVAELTIQDTIALKAIGIIHTRLPDGSKGYSFLLLVTAEFTPIQLGFGFTLNGVGGLIAINRSMDLEALREGVRTNAINSILFPDDPVAQAPQIISDLNTIFPATEGQYAFGLMGILGWGTPTLVELQMGLMLEVPDPVRLAILGILKLEVGVEDLDILKLQVNFLGAIDFEQKMISFDASLFDSQLLTFDLGGDMAFRMSWGNQPNFLFSAGGFHPDFEPPPLSLPDLRRMTIDLFKGDPRLGLSAYFAVTSNTLQMGAAAEFYMTVSKTLNVYIEGYLGFDALFRFSPFYMKINIDASLSVKQKQNTLLGISLSGQLEGPTPWHVKGEAEFKALGIKFSPDFDIKTGKRDNTTLPPINLLPELTTALSDDRNWQLLPPASHVNLVNMRELELPEEEQAIHPLGALSVSQRIIPLGIELEKVGQQKPGDYEEFELELVDADGQLIESEDVKDHFPAAQFIKMSNDEKVSRASFELFDAGIQASDKHSISFGKYTEKEVSYELSSIIDSRLSSTQSSQIDKGSIQVGSTIHFEKWAHNGSIANSVFGQKHTARTDRSQVAVKLKEQTFALATTSDVNRYGTFQASTQTAAHQELQKIIKTHPVLAGQLQVMPLEEIESI